MSNEQDDEGNSNPAGSVLLLPDFAPVRGPLSKLFRWSFYLFAGLGTVIAFFPLESAFGRSLCASALRLAGPLTNMAHFYDNETPQLGCRMLLSFWVFPPFIAILAPLTVLLICTYVEKETRKNAGRLRYISILWSAFILFFSAFYVFPGSRYGGPGQLIFGTSIVLIFVSFVWLFLFFLILETTIVIIKSWRSVR
ncbi:hypothetical protein [Neorhizobium tomejilense]|uniref:hypothetical protein n=1 Tax=Neorhizobium tomejilense TaxID=2093828 RepID=UPI003ED10A9F